MAMPPLDDGADHETDADPSPREAATDTGGPGTVRGNVGMLGTLATESPMALVAVTVNVYDVVLLNPVHNAVSPETTHEPAAGDTDTAYEVTGSPPSEAGADQLSATLPGPGLADRP